MRKQVMNIRNHFIFMLQEGRPTGNFKQICCSTFRKCCKYILRKLMLSNSTDHELCVPRVNKQHVSHCLFMNSASCHEHQTFFREIFVLIQLHTIGSRMGLVCHFMAYSVHTITCKPVMVSGVWMEIYRWDFPSYLP